MLLTATSTLHSHKEIQCSLLAWVEKESDEQKKYDIIVYVDLAHER